MVYLSTMVCDNFSYWTAGVYAKCYMYVTCAAQFTGPGGLSWTVQTFLSLATYAMVHADRADGNRKGQNSEKQRQTIEAVGFPRLFCFFS